MRTSHHPTTADERGGANILAAIGTPGVGAVGNVVTVEEHLRL